MYILCVCVWGVCECVCMYCVGGCTCMCIYCVGVVHVFVLCVCVGVYVYGVSILDMVTWVWLAELFCTSC